MLLRQSLTDLCGPFSNTPALDGELYAMIILDQFSHFAEVFCIKHKSEALQCFKIFRNRAKTLHNKVIKILRMDGRASSPLPSL